MKASLFYLPSIGSRAEIETGLAGMNPSFYQRMLAELSEQIRLADDLGYHSVSFSEHHFQSCRSVERSSSYACQQDRAPAGRLISRDQLQLHSFESNRQL